MIEIDEKNHNKYDKTDHEDRQKILESCGYYFIRITLNKMSNEELISKIDEEINNYQLLFAKDIDPEVLWSKLNKNSIDKDFFDTIGKSIVCNKKYCVNFDDIVEFVGYSRKDNAKHFLLENYRPDQDYIMCRKAELDDREDVLLLNIQERNKSKASNNKIYIFLTKFAFYSFVISTNTRKAKEIRTRDDNSHPRFITLVHESIITNSVCYYCHEYSRPNCYNYPKPP